MSETLCPFSLLAPLSTTGWMLSHRVVWASTLPSEGGFEMDWKGFVIFLFILKVSISALVASVVSLIETGM